MVEKIRAVCRAGFNLGAKAVVFVLDFAGFLGDVEEIKKLFWR